MMRRCVEPGCRELTRTTRCPSHTRTNYARRAPSGWAWSHIRALVIERDGGQCVECGSVLDLRVDHIVPLRLGGTSAMSNLRTLCRPHHMAVTPNGGG